MDEISYLVDFERHKGAAIERDFDVSVIIPAFNASSTIEAAITSVLTQSAVSAEIIVVDDASHDDTANQVFDLRIPALQVVRLGTNAGPAAARNAGLAVATGRWVALLDADDRFLEGRLAVLTAAGEAHGLDLIADDLWCVAEDGARAPLLGDDATPRGLVSLAAFVSGNVLQGNRPSLGYLKPLFRKSFLDRHAIRYRPDLRIGEDYHIVLDCLAAGAKYEIHASRDYLYSRRAGSISHRLGAEHVDRLLAADADFTQKHAGSLSPAARDALAARRRGLVTAASFARMVDALKKRDIRTFAKLAVRRPSALLSFREALVKRAQRWGLLR